VVCQLAVRYTGNGGKAGASDHRRAIVLL